MFQVNFCIIDSFVILPFKVLAMFPPSPHFKLDVGVENLLRQVSEPYKNTENAMHDDGKHYLALILSHSYSLTHSINL